MTKGAGASEEGPPTSLGAQHPGKHRCSGMWDVAGEASLHPSAKASPVVRYARHAMLYKEHQRTRWKGDTPGGTGMDMHKQSELQKINEHHEVNTCVISP